MSDTQSERKDTTVIYTDAVLQAIKGFIDGRERIFLIDNPDLSPDQKEAVERFTKYLDTGIEKMMRENEDKTIA